MTSEPLEDLVLFIDRSLGKHSVASELRAVGAHVEIHDDHFSADETDANWIVEVGRRKWLILTKDKRIQHRALEQAAVAVASVRLFALTGGNMTGSEMGAIFAKSYRKIVRFAAANKPPFIAKVHKDGSIAMALSQKQLKRRWR